MVGKRYGNKRYVLTEETAIRLENGRLSAFLFVFRFRRYTRMTSGRGNTGKCSVNALAYDSEVRRGSMDGGLFSETVMYGEKMKNGLRIA